MSLTPLTITAHDLHILISYWYYKDIDLDTAIPKHFKEPYPTFFADSGAFTAYTQKAVITPAAYMTWIMRYRHWFTTVANLDVIGSAQGTWDHQHYIEQHYPVVPLPVFHTGESWDWLTRYLERYPYIALGGMVGKHASLLMPWAIRCFKMAQGQAVYHGFGVTSWEILKALPWYSVDSSAWGSGFRYGTMMVFDMRQGRFHKIRLRAYQDWYKYTSVVRELGFNPEDFADPKRYDRAKASALAAISFLYAQAWLRRRHGLIYIPRRETSTGAGAQIALVAGHNLPASDTGIGNIGAGMNVHLVNTSYAMAPLRDADAGVKVHIADTDISNLSHAAAGINVPLVDGCNYTRLKEADAGLKLHLVDARPPGFTDTASPQPYLTQEAHAHHSDL